MPSPALDVAVGAVFCVSGGLLLLLARGQRGPGRLLLLTGAAWLLGSVLPAAVFLHRGPLIQLLVTYPRARPRGRLEWVVVSIGYLTTVQPIGKNPWGTAGMALLVAGAVVSGQRRASGAERRARLTSSATALVLMAVLGVGAVARLAGLDIDPGLLVGYQLALLAAAAALFVDAQWGRWNRAAITALVVDLGRSEGAGGVRDDLARALSDPGLELDFLDPGSGSLVDQAGRRTKPTRAGAGRQWTTLRHDGQDIALLGHGVGALDDPALLDSVTALTRMAYANARLHADVLARVTDVDASRRRILEVSDRERQALEEELRSGTEPRLDLVGRLLAPAASELNGLLQDSRASLRDFALGVHPRSLAAGGLAAACADLARTAPVPVSVDVPGIRLAPEVELSLYFVCAEAVTNVVKYADASRVRIQLVDAGGRITLAISDDGSGGAALGGPGDTGGTGLRGLADRLAVIGGTLTIDSPEGRGTTVVAEVLGRPT